MEIIYLNHSGFLVDTGKTVLFFDYYTENGALDCLDLKKFEGKDIYVFASHEHADHFDRRILSWNGVTYLFSKEIRCPKSDQMYFFKSGEHRNIGALQVHTLRSTDSGVAFVVEVDGKKIYHAGDLNWWHWNGESDAFNNMIKKQYTSEISKIKGVSIDIGFVPVDPRLEDKYILAIDYLMQNVDIKHVFPMHFWQDYAIYNKLMGAPRTKEYRERIEKITKPGQVFKL